MNDEIKEILDRIETASEIFDCLLKPEECTELLDYITNLQQENERLKAKYNNNKSHEVNYKYFTTLYSKATKDIVIDDLVYKCEDLDNLRQSYEKLYIEQEDYKSRCEKASDKLGRYKHYSTPTEEQNSENEDIVDSALNILQNGSDSQ